MKWILIVLGILILLIGIVLLIGFLLPKTHKTTLNKTFEASPEEVWNRIYDFRNYKDWRKGLKQIDVISDDTWAEIDQRNDKITLQVIEAQPEKKMVSKIIDETLPFGGTWTFELIETGNRTQLIITEDGEITNVMYRFFAHFVFGYEATIKQYLNDLENSLK